MGRRRDLQFVVVKYVIGTRACMDRNTILISISVWFRFHVIDIFSKDSVLVLFKDWAWNSGSQ